MGARRKKTSRETVISAIWPSIPLRLIFVRTGGRKKKKKKKKKEKRGIKKTAATLVFICNCVTHERFGVRHVDA